MSGQGGGGSKEEGDGCSEARPLEIACVSS